MFPPSLWNWKIDRRILILDYEGAKGNITLHANLRRFETVAVDRVQVDARLDEDFHQILHYRSDVVVRHSYDGSL